MTKKYQFILNLIVIFSLTSIEARAKQAVVSGQSVIGMMAAILLAKSGYEVDVFEERNFYTRNIHWAARQSLVDELASLDKELANLFLQEVAHPIYRGSIHIYPAF